MCIWLETVYFNLVHNKFDNPILFSACRTRRHVRSRPLQLRISSGHGLWGPYTPPAPDATASAACSRPNVPVSISGSCSTSKRWSSATSVHTCSHLICHNATAATNGFHQCTVTIRRPAIGTASAGSIWQSTARRYRSATAVDAVLRAGGDYSSTGSRYVLNFK